jgi:hypothetical protein
MPPGEVQAPLLEYCFCAVSEEQFNSDDACSAATAFLAMNRKAIINNSFTTTFKLLAQME